MQKDLQLPKEKSIQSQEDEELLVPTDFAASQKAAKRTRNIIFYGPPGTGKTWMVENFSTYLLLQKNASNRDANSYWDAIASRTVAADDASQGVGTDDASPGASSNNSDSSVKDTLRREVRGPLSSPSTQATVWAIEPLHDRSHEHWAKFFSNTQEEDWDSAPQVFLEEAQSGDFILVNYKKDDEDLLGIAAVQTDLEQVAITGVRLLKIGPISMSPNPVLPKWGSRFNNFEIVNAYGGARMYRLSEDQAQDIWRQFKKSGYNISHPGIAERVVTPAQNYYEVVTFHQSFSYEDFVEGLRPQAASNGQVEYVVQDGVFKKFSKKAERYWKELGDDAPQFVFVIDEANRANIAKVFGELISLIEDDKRLGERNALSVTLPYSKDDFGIPPNLYIFGTMNTADRSLTIIDIALRRRFAFIEIDPDATKLGSVKDLSLSALLKRINLRLRMVLDSEYKIGHSYFFNLENSDDVEGLHFVWNQYIIPLLQEYFYGDIQRLRAFLGDEFMEGLEIEDSANDLSGYRNNEESNYQIKKLGADELLKALKKFVS